MLFVIFLLFVASSVSVEEEHVEFEPFPDYYAMLNVSMLFKFLKVLLNNLVTSILYYISINLH